MAPAQEFRHVRERHGNAAASPRRQQRCSAACRRLRQLRLAYIRPLSHRESLGSPKRETENGRCQITLMLPLRIRNSDVRS